ncbi:hypothetical protein GAY30_22670 [Azospirillum brasilense]|nr:hypothetical protein [Azospirillum brasilense]NUB31442.1 hypothetical protein [Azospirillum brasilense]RIW03064.1 hypothetical protein D2T81_14155 [Azospirillum brasilense]
MDAPVTTARDWVAARAMGAVLFAKRESPSAQLRMEAVGSAFSAAVLRHPGQAQRSGAAEKCTRLNQAVLVPNF